MNRMEFIAGKSAIALFFFLFGGWGMALAGDGLETAQIARAILGVLIAVGSLAIVFLIVWVMFSDSLTMMESEQQEDK